MKMQFDAISELGHPGPKFLKLFQSYWPEYERWIDSDDSTISASLEESITALRLHMPEMVSTYHRLCGLTRADKKIAKFLTGFQPPPSISGCSQAVITKNDIQLIRNYDYDPNLLEGTLLLSSWNGKKVIVNSDCLIGALDGMNEAGLAISLTFGGRKAHGTGFGISFILRYILEFCYTTEEAVAALVRIPSHMSYNVTVVDKTGKYNTVLISPDNEAVVTEAAYTTNYQGTVDWPENAFFNNTVERSKFLEKLFAIKEWDSFSFCESFLQKPLYSNLYEEGFGTLYTSIYHPITGSIELRWPSKSIHQSFTNFTEGSTKIDFKGPETTIEGR